MGTADVMIVTVSCLDTFPVGASVAGLSESKLQLRLNERSPLPLASNGAFSFPSPLSVEEPFSVQIISQPQAQLCDLSGGILRLRNNGSDELAVAANGTFRFSLPIAHGAPYAVSISEIPASQRCSLANAPGTVERAAVTGVNVTCQALRAVGGTVSGLAGTLVLENNGGDDLLLNAKPGIFTRTSTFAKTGRGIWLPSATETGATSGATASWRRVRVPVST